MTREEIKKFDYSAFISLAQQDENIREALMREGYNIEGLIRFRSYNGGFKKAMLRVYRELVEPSDYYMAVFTGLSQLLKSKDKTPKTFLAIITLNNQVMLADAMREKGDEEVDAVDMSPEEILSGIQGECIWVENSGFSIEVVRPIQKNEIEKLTQR